MNFINKLEKKFGRYAIPNLMKYVIMLYAIGLIMGMFSPLVYYRYFSLDFSMILKGQVWRLVTFIIPYISMSNITNILFVAIKAYLYYMIGNALERSWGSFRLNLYFFSGIIFNILAGLLIYFLNPYYIYNTSLEYIYQAMFFAFAALYPNTQFLIYFLIPVKVKYLAWISGGLYVYSIVGSIANDRFLEVVPIVASMINFLIFFLATRKYRGISPREFQRKAKFHRQMNEARNRGNVSQQNGRNVITRHKCAVCGRTELDDDQLEFRFCSKCEGNYEYCMEHLFTHEHVKK